MDRIKSTLSSDLDHLFATTLLSLNPGENSGKALPSEQDRARWKSDLKECLRTYDALGGWREAEEVVRREIVKSFVKQVCVFSSYYTNNIFIYLRPYLPERSLSHTRPLFLGPRSLRVFSHLGN